MPEEATPVARMVEGDQPAAGDAAPSIVVDPRWGYRRLDPMPSTPELDQFYESRYRDLILAGGRAPDVARLMVRGPEADRERAWLAATLHDDVIAIGEAGVATGLPRRSLDVGAGTGDLVGSLALAGWDACGTEPAVEIADVARARGLAVEPVTAEAYLESWRDRGEEPYSLVTLINVLEHIPDPVRLLANIVAVLAPGGRLVVRVPNDFNPLQLAAQRALGVDPWWIAIPDHVNYFDHRSLAALLEGCGLEVVDQVADYPMELFLLGGEDYTCDPEAGTRCHERRRRTELAMPPDVRRGLGRGWAAAGLGRNAMAIARRVSGVA